MKLSTFGYRGNFVFSQPIQISNADENLLVLATPYGDHELIQDALDKMVNEFEGLIADPDSTSPYSKLTCLTPTENLLYTTTQFLNDYISSNHNQDSLDIGCDLCMLYKKDNRVYLSQIGWPLIVLHHENINVPISSDYASYPSSKDSGVFIPSYLLGLESSVNVKIQSFSVNSDSKILILKSNENPDGLLTLYPTNLESVAKTFVGVDPNQGFWLGEVSF